MVWFGSALRVFYLALCVCISFGLFWFVCVVLNLMLFCVGAHGCVLFYMDVVLFRFVLSLASRCLDVFCCYLQCVCLFCFALH